ncbi:MAG TPA: ABC transporter ATP-binding protein [Wenzhouxiangellaceae bacterium]|nr:ABC transporter ATP-binding protein [Wenzhouxiangellaceae bacterium]
MSRPLLRVQRVEKRYPPAAAQPGRLRAFWQLLTRGRAEGGTRVLDEISFEVRAGESMGIVGANGAGKSTLLKMITGVLAPSSGSIEVNGSISALLELGAGFQPEYTGMENLRMNAGFLGLSRDQIDASLDDILAFADIGKAIDEPIKHYSSGMVVRLGFAIVASVRPDLLITDEVLAVGDESFQKKCIRWVEDYLAGGGTLLMVSHNMYQVQKLCRQAVWLHEGSARAIGDVFDVTQAYLAWHERKDTREQQSRPAPSGAVCRIDDLALEPQAASGPPRVEMGGRLLVRIRLRSPDDRVPVVLVGLARGDGTPVYGVASDHDDFRAEPVGGGCFEITLEYPELNVLPGGYVVRAHAMDPEGLRVHDTVEIELTVSGKSRALGLVYLPHRWHAGDRSSS